MRDVSPVAGSLDFTKPEVHVVVHNTLRSVVKGSIVSMHCGHDDTIRALPRVHRGQADRGRRAASMTGLMS